MRTLPGLLLVVSLAPAQLVAQEVTGSAAVTAQYQDPETIERITNRLAGRARESWNTVIADSEPPLTWGTVATLSLRLHECYDAQLTEAEAELVAKRLAASYESSDAKGRKELTDWQSLTCPQLKTRVQAAAEAKSGWGVAVREALDRRNRAVQKSQHPAPGWCVPGFDASMSVADLDASMEMLYFMWVAAGRDPELVTLEGVAAIRNHFRYQFATLPVDLQYALANAQKIYAGLRVLWYTGNAAQRTNLARNFSQELDALGLPDPNPRRQQSAKSYDGSRGAFAAEMVVGLAGSSYKSAW